MHEMSIAQSIVEIVEEILENEPESRLRKVIVEVGELTAVVPESLEFCYQALTAGTKFENSRIVIEKIPVVARCKNCHREFPTDTVFMLCPHCESNDIEILSGQELQVRELEVE